MPLIDTDTLPPIAMRDGVAGRWLSSADHGAAGVGVLRNWVEPGITIPRHRHDAEEVVVVERGEMWVEIDGVRYQAGPGRTVIVPARAVHAWGTFQEKVQLLFIWPDANPFAAGKSTYLEGTAPAVA